MAGYHIGKLIEEERKRHGVTRKQLSSGIFSHQMLYKIEANECESDKILIDILLQRLGRSPDKLEIFMSMAQYKKIRLQDLIKELILKKKTNKAEYLLEQYKAHYGEQNNVHMMFYNRFKAYLILQRDGNLDEALMYIIKAIKQTLPDWDKRKISEFLISTYEIENLLLYSKIIYLMGRVDEARVHLNECIKYIENHYIDTEEFAKIYPKCVWLMSKVCQDKEYDDVIVEFCEKALDILRREAIGCFVMPVMVEIIPRYIRMGNNVRAEYWQRFYDTFKSIYEKHAPEECIDSLFANVCQSEYHLDYETIKGQRVSNGYTQEDIIKDVFTSTKPLSCIEHNKKNVTKNHFEMLMNNMGIDKGKYNGLLATDSFDVLQKKNVLDYFGCLGDYENADKVLTELEELLDENIDDNRRFIEINRIIIDKERGNISIEEALNKCEALLAETYNVDANNNRPPMRNEIVIINQMGICLGELGKVNEQIKMLGKVKRCYEKGKIDKKYYVRSYLLLNANYIIAMYESDNTKEAINLAKEAISSDLIYAKTRLLPHYCAIMAYSSRDNSKNADECKTYFKWAYNLHEFNLNKSSCDIVAAYYKAKYDEEIVN